MSKGCIIVMQVGSGQILASTSMPEFDPDDIAASIRADDTSLINRSLSAFSAGSVFKVVLAAAAYARGWTGSPMTAPAASRRRGKPSAVRWGGRTAPSTCAARWNKAVTVTLLRWASCWAAGNSECRAELWPWHPALLAPGLKSAAGELPSAADLQNAGSLASLSFGQGGLTVTPLQVTAMFNAIRLRRGISQPLYCQQHHRRDASSAAAAARSGLQPGGCTGAAKYAGNRCPQRHWRRCPAPYWYRRR